MKSRPVMRNLEFMQLSVLLKSYAFFVKHKLKY